VGNRCNVSSFAGLENREAEAFGPPLIPATERLRTWSLFHRGGLRGYLFLMLPRLLSLKNLQNEHEGPTHPPAAGRSEPAEKEGLVTSPLETLPMELFPLFMEAFADHNCGGHGAGLELPKAPGGLDGDTRSVDLTGQTGRAGCAAWPASLSQVSTTHVA
jgi:hypothetical protein